MDEFGLIERYFAGPQGQDPAPGPDSGPAAIVLGIGDDCALFAPPPPGHLLAVSTDMLVEGRHFFAGTPAAAIGHKTLAVNLSDLAAMGAEPLGFTLALALPAVDPGWLEEFSQGLLTLARRHRCPLVGGDTTRGPLCLSVTVFGRVPAAQALRRDGGRVGDDLWVSGALGAAASAVAARQAGRSPLPGAAERLDWPEPRVGVGLALRGLASAAIDLSDGLGGDLAHILEASSRVAGPLGAIIEEGRLPLAPALQGLGRESALALALHGGDDYELLFTAPAGHRDRIAALAVEGQGRGRGLAGDSAPGGPVRIGSLVAGAGIVIVAPDGGSRPLDARGFNHFRDEEGR